MFRFICATVGALFWVNCAANATVITADVADLGGGNYEAIFNVDNDSPGLTIEEFTIFFPVGDFENIAITASPLDWDGLAIEPDPGIPDDGFADWLALGAPIGFGETLDGFSLTFTLVGGALPELLAFAIIDPFSFETIESGFAVLAYAPASEVPLPATAWLFLTGFAFLWRRVGSN